MARPREFDAEEAMDKAMELFWNVGFEEASLSELLGAMEITKGSFYKAFQDKKSIYLASLDRYNEKVIAETVAFLRNPENGAGRDRVLGLFRKVELAALEDGDRLGCFLCNALVDKANEGGEIEQKLQAMVQRLEQAFADALEGDDRSENSLTAKQALETARGLLSLYFGMRVLGRSGLAGSMVSDCVRQAEILLVAASNEDGGRLPSRG